jgi:hypothetical protein
MKVTLEQVKEHFKYAKEVRCLADGKTYDFTNITEESVYDVGEYFWFRDSKSTPKHTDECALYCKQTSQFATIISYIFERGEEVEVKTCADEWIKRFFIGFNREGQPVTETKDGSVMYWDEIRKLSPETQLQPQIDALKQKAKEINCTVTVIFENK